MKTARRKKTPADAGIRKTLEKMFAAWSDLDPAQAAPFYAKDPGLVFFDIAPMKYTGWAEIAAEVPKALAAYRSLKLTSEPAGASYRQPRLGPPFCTATSPRRWRHYLWTCATRPFWKSGVRQG